MSNNNNSSRLFTVRFLYTLIEKGHSVLTDDLLNNEQLNVKIDDFLNSYREPDQENPYSDISDEQVFRAKEIIKNIQSSLETFHETINSHLKQDFNALKKMDYCILLVGTCEILKHSVPFQVIANEMVQISKEFSSENSPQFINGVLDGIGRNT